MSISSEIPGGIWSVFPLTPAACFLREGRVPAPGFSKGYRNKFPWAFSVNLKGGEDRVFEESCRGVRQSFSKGIATDFLGNPS